MLPYYTSFAATCILYHDLFRLSIAFLKFFYYFFTRLFVKKYLSDPTFSCPLLLTVNVTFNKGARLIEHKTFIEGHKKGLSY